MFNQTHPRKQKAYLALAIFTAYAMLALLSTWPLVTQLTTHLPGGSDDTQLHYWNGWSVQQALSSGQSPFYTRLIFYPNGVSLVTHNMAWLQILPWLLFEPLMGGILAYNVVLLLHLTLAGSALFCLTHHLTGDLRAAFLGGLIYLAWPFRISQLDHPNLLATFCIPLFFLFLIRTIQQTGWRDSLLAGLFFALIGYTRWQLLIPATIMALVYLLLRLPSWQRSWQRVLPRLLLAGAIAMIALLPAMLLLRAQISRDNSASLLREGEEAVMQSDLLAYVTPPASHPLLGEQTAPLYDLYYHDRAPHRRYTAYIGLGTFLLVLLGIWYKRWQSIPWLVMGIILICLALGPLLRVNGIFYERIPMLYEALSGTFILRLIRVPDRFNMFLALPISVLAAYGASGLLRQHPFLRKPGRPFLLITLLGVFIFMEYLAIPVPRHDVSTTDSFYSQLAEEPSDFAIVNLPFDPLRAKVYMFNQVTHQRPIMQGNTSRLPDDAYRTIDSNPWLAFLRQTHEMSPAFTDIGRQLAYLSQEQIRYLIMHKWFIEDYRIAHWQRYLLTEPRYENDRLIVYSTAPEIERDFTLRQEFPSGLGIIKSLLSTDCVNPNGILEVDVGWGSRRALAQSFDLVISLVDSTGMIRQSNIYALSESWPTNQWAANSVAWGYYTLLVEPVLAAGEYSVRLNVLDAATGKSQGESMTIDQLTVQSESCHLSPLPLVAEAKTLNAVFGNNLRLVAYQLEHEEGRLDLTLDWRSERRMETDYKIFVHLFDPATGIPVAQDDAMPRRNAYPTTLWWPGEMVDDQITLFLYGVPAGNYRIAIGVYDPVSGQRLQLVNGQNEVIEDGRLILQEQLELE